MFKLTRHILKMNVDAYLGRSGFYSMVPLVKRLVFPSPDIKAEPKDETSGQSEFYSDEGEFKCVFKVEIADDPLEDNDTYQAKDSTRPGYDHSQDLKMQPKETTDSLDVEECNYVIKHEITDEEDPLGGEKSSKVVIKEEEVTSNIEDSTINSMPTIYPCNHCDVSFTLPRYLEKHVKSCTGKKKAVRISTKNLTSDLKSLARFVNGQKLFFCQLCEYNTDQFGRLNRHQVVHTGVRNYICEVCKKSFTQSHHLAEHRQTHTGVKVFKCAKCDFSTTRESNLRRHDVSIHSGKKMYACTMCKYKATQSYGLTRHIKRKHSDDRPFSCAHCDYSAPDKDRLKQHLVSKHSLIAHSNKKSFCCTHCDFRTANKGTCKVHIRKIHSGDKPFSCEHCEFRTAYSSSLKKHKLCKH